MDRRYPPWREATPASPYTKPNTKPKIRLRKGFSMARRRRRPALGITRTGPLWTMWKNLYVVMRKGLSCVPIVENLGDGYGNAGTGPRIAQSGMEPGLRKPHRPARRESRLERLGIAPARPVPLAPEGETTRPF